MGGYFGGRLAKNQEADVVRFFPDPQGTPHAALGMYELFTIAGDSGAALPEPDATITATDAGLQLPTLSSASRRWNSRTGGTEPHELALVVFEPGKGIKDVDRWIGSGYQGEPPRDLPRWHADDPGERVGLSLDRPRAGRRVHGPRLHHELEGDVHGLLMA